MSRLQRGLSGINAGNTSMSGSRMGSISQGGGAARDGKSFDELKRIIHAKLVDQSLSRALVDVRCFRLPSRAIQREHQLPAESLAKRMLIDKRDELTHQFVVVSESELGFDPFF